MTGMFHQAAALEALFAGGGVLRTRLRERSSCDVHDFPSHPPALPGMAMGPQELLTALEQLADRGVVARSELVHPYDSSEYIVTWRLAEVSRAPRSRADSPAQETA